jgi:hypothetical protein
VSDVSQGPGWWLASDGKWYSPDQKPGPASPDLPPMGGPGAEAGPGRPPIAPGYGPPAGGRGYYAPTGPPGYGAPPMSSGYHPASGPPGYGPPPMSSGYGYPSGGGSYGYAPETTNGLAIAGFVCSLFFWVYGVGAVLGIIFGFIARSQIRQSGNTQKGDGLALAGIIIGFIGIAIGVVLVIVLVAYAHHCDQLGNNFCTSNTVNFGNGN